MTVISFTAEREARKPHWEGKVHCVGCQHEWEGVAPLGTLWVDCPSCGLPKGAPKHPFGAGQDDLLFKCNCGSEALTAYVKKGVFRICCMACGANQTNAIYGDPC